MPRIEETPRPTWKEIHNMIYENLFTACPEKIEHIKEEINKILEERPHVCKTNKRNND